ncbi:DUF6247 family protein [Pseudonocardia pini]|uniref:DUF6247 family protein n=1 Tax=Pseudonocardia pini TaxID=2758030 RepID=UPI001C693B92|nr:DUF6247 family protein [Pseudonocardia pini]
MSSAASPVPELAPDATPAAIRAALVPEEREQFERAYRAAMIDATESLDLTGVLSILRAYHRIAVMTHRQGAEAHQRMLDKAREILTTGRNSTGVDIAEHRADLNRRLGR